MLPFRLVYHDGYDLDLGDHVFPVAEVPADPGEAARRRRRVSRRISSRPRPPRTTTSPWCTTGGGSSACSTGTLSYRGYLQAGDSLLPPNGQGLPAGRGRHHPGRAAWRCATASASTSAAASITPFATTARASARSTTWPWPSAACSARAAIERAMVVDCDVHHGNGTAAIFAGDRQVFTLSIHQFNNYPAEKPPPTSTSICPTRPAMRSTWSAARALRSRRSGSTGPT